MIKKIKVPRKKFRRGNLNAFLFFILFSVVVWVFVQFSKEYIQLINVPVNYVNVPMDKFLTEDNPEKLQLRMENTGFKIAWFSLFPPTLNIDLSEAQYGNGELVYEIEDHRIDIQEQLGINFDNTRFLLDVLTIEYEQLKEKTLPVIPEVQIGFAVGYAATDSLKIAPDSIRISGPEGVIDTLQNLKTFPVDLKDVKGDIRGTVAIDTTGIPHVNLYQNKVEYRLDVEKFTEGKLKVPVDILNVPEGVNVVIFPKEVLLFYQVNLQDFKKITASDFRIAVDFSNLKPNQSFLIPKIVEKPELVNNIRLNENKIQVIIKK